MAKTLTQVFGDFYNGLSEHGICAGVACVELPKMEFFALHAKLEQEFTGLLVKADDGARAGEMRLHGIRIIRKST
jgi:hypothetical protein